LPLSVDDLFSLEAALEDAGETPRRIAGDRYVVEPMPDAEIEPTEVFGRG
jgi:hypothetical protein